MRENYFKGRFGTKAGCVLVSAALAASVVATPSLAFASETSGSENLVNEVTEPVNPGATAESLKWLEDSIRTATNELLAVSVSEDGSDVAKGQKWVTQVEYSKFASAVENATAVLSSDPSQEAVDDACADLKLAREAFALAQKDGTKAPASAEQGNSGNAGATSGSDANSANKPADTAAKPAASAKASDAATIAKTSDAGMTVAGVAAAGGIVAAIAGLFAHRRLRD